MQMLQTQAGEGGFHEKLVTCLSTKTHEAPEAVLTISHRHTIKRGETSQETAAQTLLIVSD